MRSTFILLAGAAMLTSAVASAQTKKVVLEDYTGAWCQYCPDGTFIMDGLATANPTNLIAIASHNTNGYGTAADPLAIPEGEAIPTAIGIGGFPSGGIDRKMFSGEPKTGVSRSKWATYFNQQAANTAIVSVSITNTVENDGMYEGDVVFKFTAAPEAGVPVTLQVYILENGIEATVANGLKQKNTTSNYGGADPATSADGYYHDHTLRAALGGIWGWDDIITGDVEVDKEYTKHFSFEIPATAVPQAWVKEELEVVAFVAYNGAASAGKKEILNAERITSFSFYNAGVENVNKVNIATVYPNPANVNSVIHVEYNQPTTGNVSMSVYNAIGQIVAKPYDSYEVRGSHTIQWRASDYDLAPGTYFMNVSTSEGSSVNKVVIH